MNPNSSHAYALPKINRIPSSHMPDHSGSFGNDSIYNTTRTVSSSSTSMMSTPSNNMRRLQRQQLAAPDAGPHKQQHDKKKPISQKQSKNGRLIKSKLLNLHQSSKRYIDQVYGADGDDERGESEVDPSHPNQSVPGFILHKPINMNSYDYSVFTNYPDGTDLQHGEKLPPAVKESQIKAWESAEKISRNVIFGDASDSDDAGDDSAAGADAGHSITYLPGYTREELAVIQRVFGGGSSSASAAASEEKRQLYELKKKVQGHHERLLSQTHAASTRRQVQITQKKELLNKMFGYANNLNREYITNNSLYSALDTSANLQKTLHEDKEEIAALLAEDTAYTAGLMESARRSADARGPAKNRDDDDDFDYAAYRKVVSQKLDELYARGDHDIGANDDDEDDDDDARELQQFATAYLRRCIKEADDA